MTNEFFFDEDDSKKIKRPKKKLWFFLVIALLFVGVCVLSFEWALDALIHTRKEVTTPDITKKSVSNALDLLEAEGLALKKAGEEHVPEVAAGFVVRQLPKAGTTVREGRVIRVWISQGIETIQMPNLVGMTLRNAQVALRQAGLNPGTTTTVYSLTHEKGIVTAQSFPEAAPINKGDTVNLVVSNGAPQATVILVPDFRQKKLTEASRWASQNDIELITKDDPNSLFANGTIVFQNPNPDSEVSRGSSLTITVSRRKAEEGEEKMHRIHYELPQGKRASKVRIILIDQSGEREVMNESKQPGSKIDLSVPYGGDARVRIYVNDILVREREMH
ncbi:serine/threonine protein kinase [Parelusimicrobium proximum]|uniref:PASTA domain-containing protein n=1 Tax=Parelusimicrobium proximum TaxID=3228953 RepID=UPI003D17587D